MKVRITALCAMTMIALTAPAVAQADPRDDDFVNNLAGQGITGDPAKLISTAQNVCITSKQLTSTAVPGGLGNMMPMGYVLTSLHLNMGQIGQFMDTAKATYCPPPAAPAAAAPPAGAPGAPAPEPGAPAPAPGAPAPAADALANAPALPSMAGMPALPGLGGGIAGIPGMDRLSSALGAAGS